MAPVPPVSGTQRPPEAERRLSQVQAGVGGRLHKRIFGTRCEATICAKVQLGDTQTRTGKGRSSHTEPPLGEKEQMKGAGAERGRMERIEGQEEKQE